jgi:sugar lactone lactonase YvrE
MSRLLAIPIVLALVCAGCGQQAAPVPEAAAVEAPLEAPEEYALARTLPTGVEGLMGIALDPQDNIYAAGARAVRVLSPDGAPLREWALDGPATCVALDAEGNVYVGRQRQVEVFTPDGRRLRAWGKAGREAGELDYVTAIAVHKTNVLVADAGNRCIHRYDTTGDFIDDIGARDPGAGLPGLICPSPHLDLAVDTGGTIWVTNPGLLRVETYSLGGRLLGHWGEGGSQPQQFAGCCNPTAIALRPDGAVVTAEKVAPRVKVYDAGGGLLAFLGPQYFTKDEDWLDVAVDSGGRLLVADPGDGAIRVFERRK